MQGTSANYAPYVDEIRTDALIEFELIDVDAAKVAGATSNTESTSFSKLPQVHNNITQNSMKLATLERDLWTLDGSFSLPNRVDNLETGYFSSTLSDASGACDVLITFTFSEPQDSDGFTLIFDTKAEEVASEFTITTYNQSGTVIGSKTVTGNSDVVCYVDLPTLRYMRIDLRFTRTAKPYRRIRLTEFVFGRIQQFKSDKIKDMRVIYESGVYMENMPASTLTFTIDNSDRGYNVLNPEGIYAFLQQGQGINASITVNGESVNMGRFYFETAKANDDALTATVTAYDLLYRLDNSTCNIGTTGTWTVQQAVEAVVADSGAELTINIPSEIGSRVIGKCIPQNTRHREALRYIAQAGRCVLYFNRIGELKAKEYDWTEAVDILTGRNMRSWGDAKDTGLINFVKVSVKNDYAKTEVAYTATDRQLGEPLKVLEVNNPLATQETANWILQCVKHRNRYDAPVQANPARDIGDCISIANVYGYSDNAVITKQETAYDGKILDTITAYGGGNT